MGKECRFCGAKTSDCTGIIGASTCMHHISSYDKVRQRSPIRNNNGRNGRNESNGSNEFRETIIWFYNLIEKIILFLYRYEIFKIIFDFIQKNKYTILICSVLAFQLYQMIFSVRPYKTLTFSDILNGKTTTT
jgi:hypothetical protein